MEKVTADLISKKAAEEKQLEAKAQEHFANIERTEKDLLTADDAKAIQLKQTIEQERFLLDRCKAKLADLQSNNAVDEQTSTDFRNEIETLQATKEAEATSAIMQKVAEISAIYDDMMNQCTLANDVLYGYANRVYNFKEKVQTFHPDRGLERLVGKQIQRDYFVIDYMEAHKTEQ